MKIATHNSATGEAGKNLLSFLVTPFAKCQSKPIWEQYMKGCRYFDIRIKKIGKEWHCAHGLWTSKRTADDILAELDALALDSNVYVTVMYEGRCPNVDEFIDKYHALRNKYAHLTFCELSIKKPYQIIVSDKPLCKDEYVVLDGRSWHTYIPVPWLWKKIYHNHVTYNDEYYTMVDFL